jgi:hypothetical protein
MDSETRKEKELKKRKNFNDDILKRLKAGDPLQEPSIMTWYPPRPIIQKDPTVIKNLYGNDAKIVGTKSHLKSVDDEGDNQDG